MVPHGPLSGSREPLAGAHCEWLAYLLHRNATPGAVCAGRFRIHRFARARAREMAYSLASRGRGGAEHRSPRHAYVELREDGHRPLALDPDDTGGGSGARSHRDESVRACAMLTPWKPNRVPTCRVVP